MCINFQIDLSKFLTDTWTALSRPIGYLRDPKPRITRLTDAMDHLRSQSEDLKNKIRSADLDGKTPTNEVQYWLTKVADIDEEVLKIQTDHENGSFRWLINRRAKHRLDEITTLSKNFVIDDVATQLPPIGAQEVPAEPPTATDTMKPYLDKLHACLQDDGSRIIGIWGMGGVGKTTLLQRLNNGLARASEAGRNPPMFDLVIWAVASKDYAPENLQRDIAESLRLPLCEGDRAKQKQATAILNFLKNKSFLLLLDDLWKPVDLADLGIPQLLPAGATKQKVVFTTREEGVCGQMQARPKIKVECLKEEEAWLLFQEKVGEETLQADPRISQLARQVSKECDGLPLALVVIGSTMSTKKTPQEWQNAITHLQKSRPYDIYGMDDRIFHTLKFSYDNLPDEITRKCFLLCSLWPEDYEIYKPNLIECWMGHGLVDEGKFDNINEAYDSGYDIIGGLQAACLLERGNDEDREVKMHDVIRDLALWVASDCGEKPNKFIVHYGGVIASQDSQREVERIVLIRSDLSDTSGLPANCSKLETLMLLGSWPFKSIVTGFFEGTPALTYLDLSYTTISRLPKEIGLLVNLRYLNLSDTSIESLPMELGYLCELRFLILRNLRRIDITCGVLEKLVMLSVIDMTDTRCPNWQELSRLRGRLKGVGICLESIEDLHQLAQMPNVPTWRLQLARVRFINKPLHLLSPLQYLGSRSIWSSIQWLQIQDCENLEVVSMESGGDGGGIQKWCLSRLEVLRLYELPELKEIVWRGVSPAEMLPSLTVLRIWNCHKLSNISWVIRLPSLEDLSVYDCDEMEQIIDDDNDCPFPSLKRLCLEVLKSLRVFGGRPLMFPSLEVLEVYKCPKMKTLPFGEEMAGRKLKEIRGSAEWWEELEMKDNVRAALLPFFCKELRFIKARYNFLM